MYCREVLAVGSYTQLHNYTVQAQYGNLLGKRAHTQLVRERSSSVVSACYVDRYWTLKSGMCISVCELITAVIRRIIHIILACVGKLSRNQCRVMLILNSK